MRLNSDWKLWTLDVFCVSVIALYIRRSNCDLKPVLDVFVCLFYSFVYTTIEKSVLWTELWTLDVFCVSVNPSTDNDWNNLQWIAGNLFLKLKGLKLVNLKFPVIAKLMLNSPEKCSICVANLWQRKFWIREGKNNSKQTELWNLSKIALKNRLGL